MQQIHITEENKIYAFSPYAQPIAHVAPGETVQVFTWDCFSGRLTDNCQVPSQTIYPYGNPQTGPIYIEGAEAGDTLAVDILAIDPVQDWAVSAHLLHGGGLEPQEDYYITGEPIPERVFIYKFDGKEYRYNDRLHFPWEPFLGTIATAPALEVVSASHPFRNGGNLDCPVMKPGNRVYLPVSVKGAYFYTGDCHVRQGHGEACAVAMETACKATLRFELIKDKRTAWPRVENETEMICIGVAAPMEQAARLAYSSLIRWMVELGWDKYEAYQAVTMAGRLWVGSLVSREYTMIAAIDKEIVDRACVQ